MQLHPKWNLPRNDCVGNVMLFQFLHLIFDCAKIEGSPACSRTTRFPFAQAIASTSIISTRSIHFVSNISDLQPFKIALLTRLPAKTILHKTQKRPSCVNRVTLNIEPAKEACFQNPFCFLSPYQYKGICLIYFHFAIHLDSCWDAIYCCSFSNRR